MTYHVPDPSKKGLLSPITTSDSIRLVRLHDLSGVPLPDRRPKTPYL
jgi:hypothetical protein